MSEIMNRLLRIESAEEKTYCVSISDDYDSFGKTMHDLAGLDDGMTVCFFGENTSRTFLPYIPRDKEIYIKNYGKRYSGRELSDMLEYNNLWVYDVNVTQYEERGALSNKVVVKPEVLKKRDDIYREVINSIKRNDLSPLESFAYIYSYIISLKSDAHRYRYEKDGNYFSEHADVNSDKTAVWNVDKNTALVLNDNYIDCEGFSNLLTELVEYLDDPFLKCEKIVSIENDSKSGGKVGHAICKVTVNDSKYGINGTYFSDATKDAAHINRTKKNYPDKPTPLTFFSFFMFAYGEHVANSYGSVIMNELDSSEKNSSVISGEVYQSLLQKIYSFAGGEDEKYLNDLSVLFSRLYSFWIGKEKDFGQNKTYKEANILLSSANADFENDDSGKKLAIDQMVNDKKVYDDSSNSEKKNLH